MCRARYWIPKTTNWCYVNSFCFIKIAANRRLKVSKNTVTHVSCCRTILCIITSGFTMTFLDYFPLIFFSKMTKFKEKNWEIKVLISAHLKWLWFKCPGRLMKRIRYTYCIWKTFLACWRGWNPPLQSWYSDNGGNTCQTYKLKRLSNDFLLYLSKTSLEGMLVPTYHLRYILFWNHLALFEHRSVRKLKFADIAQR